MILRFLLKRCNIWKEIRQRVILSFFDFIILYVGFLSKGVRIKFSSYIQVRRILVTVNLT